MIPEGMNDMQEGMVMKKLINILHWSELVIYNTLIELSKCEN